MNFTFERKTNLPIRGVLFSPFGEDTRDYFAKATRTFSPSSLIFILLRVAASSHSRSISLVSTVSSDSARANGGARDRPGTNSISG